MFISLSLRYDKFVSPHKFSESDAFQDVFSYFTFSQIGLDTVLFFCINYSIKTRENKERFPY